MTHIDWPMAYFVTGATGFIGRYLVQELLDNREGDVFVLVREGSQPRMERLIEQWGHDGRVTMVTGDLGEAALGVDPAWVKEHSGQDRPLLPPRRDLRHDRDRRAERDAQRRRHPQRPRARRRPRRRVFHQVSSIAASGDYPGFWDETMFDVDQRLPSPYHRTKFESERIVREESAVPWRVYRPSMVIGHSETGEMDKVDGPYYFFPILKILRDYLPSWTPLVGVDLGDTNVVPVDYVAKAMDHLAHLAGPRRRGVPPGQPRAAADRRRGQHVRRGRQGARSSPRPIDRNVTGLVPTGLLPRAVRPGTLLKGALRTPPAQLALRETIGRLGLPPAGRRARRLPDDVRRPLTEQALAGSGISVPDLESYADRLWNFWEEQLDDSLADDKKTVDGAERQDRRHHRRLVRHRPGHRVQGRPGRRHPGAGGPRQGQARGAPRPRSSRAAARRTSSPATCPTSTRSTTWPTGWPSELDSIDFLVNNAGRSIRRSVKLSHDRFHDFERTMQLNYFGAIRLVMGVLPTMREQKQRPRREHLLDRRADEPAAVQRLRRVEGRARRVEQRGQLGGASATGSPSPTSTCRW